MPEISATGQTTSSSHAGYSVQAVQQSSGVLRDDGSIVQSERLFTTRARYGAEILVNDGNNSPRGQWAYMKLMTSSTQKADYLTGGKTRQGQYSDTLMGQNGIATRMAEVTSTDKEGGPPEGTAGGGYDRMLITNISSSMQEKMQITEVFGDHEVVYYFGRRPLIFNISGLLIDSPDNNWFAEWIKLYSEVLRGTQLAKNYELIRLVLPNMILVGTISQFDWSQNSARDVDIPFSFQFIVKSLTPLDAKPGPNFANSTGIQQLRFDEYASFVSSKDIQSYKQNIGAIHAIITSPSSSIASISSALSTLNRSTPGLYADWEIRNSLEGYQKTIDGWTKAETAYTNSVLNSSAFTSVTSALEGVRLNLISPVYGVLSSLTKLVTNTFGSATTLIRSLTTPIRNILRSITDISRQAVALVNLVNNSIIGLGREINGDISGLAEDFETAIKSVGDAAGAIVRSPITASHSLLTMFSSGRMDYNTPFLRVTPKLSFIRPTLSFVSSRPVPSKIELLSALTPYNSAVSTI